MTTTDIVDVLSIPSSTRRTSKLDSIIYWTATGVVASIMLWSAYNFAFVEKMKEGFAHLGLPDWFRIELTTAKVLGTLALLIPATPKRIKEFAYFGFGLTLVSATIAHRSVGDPIVFEVVHALVFASLAVSYWYHHKRVDEPSARTT
jgi:hypothetical protein